MCGRYVIISTVLAERFGLPGAVEAPPSYNVAPGQQMPVIYMKEGIRTLEYMRWGLIPHWSREGLKGHSFINARAEDIEVKPSFRKAVREQRCLVPASGFYEWQRSNGKMPYYIFLPGAPLFAFAGIFDVWKDEKGGEIRTFAIITTAANKVVGAIHDRMPVILRPEEEKAWLDLATPLMDVLKLLKPYPDGEMEMKPVSPRVNSPRNNSPDLIT